MLKTVLRTAGVTALFAALHSVLASQFLKDQVERLFGRRARDGLYRLVFNGIALLSFLILLRALAKLPDRTLYQMRGWAALPFHVVQGFAVYMAFDANIRTGLGRMLGYRPALQFLEGEEPTPPNPAQGPQLTDDLRFHAGGSFQLTRHPNNLVPVLLWWANPKMTVRFFVFTLVSTVYLVLGSIHEEQRLAARYGSLYDRYEQGVPFYLPRLRGRQP